MTKMKEQDVTASQKEFNLISGSLTSYFPGQYYDFLHDLHRVMSPFKMPKEMQKGVRPGKFVVPECQIEMVFLQKEYFPLTIGKN